MSDQHLSPKKNKWYRLSQTPPLDPGTTMSRHALSPPRPTARRHEPARTTKIAPKTVLFPDAADSALNDDDTTCSPDNGGLLPEVTPLLDPIQGRDSETDPGEKARRVSAWLAADSFDLRLVQDHFQAMKGRNAVDVKRFDEVLYTPYSFILPDAPPLVIPDQAQKRAEQVASQSPFGEVFVFEYGVVVVWGLEEAHERSIIRDLLRFSTNPSDNDEMELEQFHFFHDNDRPPRLHNDTISLRSGSRLVKLTISHALAQSAKLTRFEAVVESTITATKDIPKTLALTGSIAMSRKAITKQIGELLITRINVNLVSNVLDAPEIFWSEPAYAPLYQTVRRYLEISQRVDLLNQRCTVISDMLDLLRDHANSMHAEYLEWIIIVLITIEILLGLIEIGMGVLSS